MAQVQDPSPRPLVMHVCQQQSMGTSTAVVVFMLLLHTKHLAAQGVYTDQAVCLRKRSPNPALTRDTQGKMGQDSWMAPSFFEPLVDPAIQRWCLRDWFNAWLREVSEKPLEEWCDQPTATAKVKYGKHGALGLQRPV